MIAAYGLGLAGVAGLALGSYAATAGLRLSRGEPSSFGRSHCDGCGRGLGAVATLPLISFIVQGGACRACGAPIDRAHPIGEIAGAVILVCAAALGDPLRGLLLGGLGLTLLATSVVDARSKRLPDRLTLAIAGLAAALAWTISWTNLAIGLAAAGAVVAVLSLVRLASSAGGRPPGLGWGDVKLLGALSLWLGLATPWAIVAGALLGLAAVLATRPADGRLAFGPFIALGAWSVGLIKELAPWPIW